MNAIDGWQQMAGACSVTTLSKPIYAASIEVAKQKNIQYLRL